MARSIRPSKVFVLVATRKGAWIYQSDGSRRTWRVSGPHFLGHTVHHMVLDPRDGRTLLAAAKTGHLGPTVFRSRDFGKTWKEAAKPPAFAKPTNDLPARSVDHTFWLTPAHANEPSVWYAGTSPQGLFRSEDGGVNWQPFSSINDDAQYRTWMGAQQDGTPDGPKMHSILIDPRDPNKSRALEGLFFVDLRITDGKPVDRLGERVFVRFDHGTEPIAFRLMRAVRQVFLSRFGL